MTVHEPTAAHLRQRVEGPVVVWELPGADELARALMVADVVNTRLRPELFTVALARQPIEPELAEALRQLASSLNLIRAWIIPSPEAGQRQALAERALVWLTEVPAGPIASVAEAVDALVGERQAA